MSEARKPVWPWIVALLIGLPVLFVLSYGPWMALRERVPYPVFRRIERLYLPLKPLVFDGPDCLTNPYLSYLELWSDAPVLQTIRAIRSDRETSRITGR
jgi:hypothetical protein